MGEQYGQLTLEERCSIARLRAAGQSIRQMAERLREINIVKVPGCREERSASNSDAAERSSFLLHVVAREIAFEHFLDFLRG